MHGCVRLCCGVPQACLNAMGPHGVPVGPKGPLGYPGVSRDPQGSPWGPHDVGECPLNSRNIGRPPQTQQQQPPAPWGVDPPQQQDGGVDPPTQQQQHLFRWGGSTPPAAADFGTSVDPIVAAQRVPFIALHGEEWEGGGSGLAGWLA